MEGRRHYCSRDRMADNATEIRNVNFRTKNETSQGYEQARAKKNIQSVPLATEPGISLIILPLMRILQRNLKRTYLIV
jgi:hypothetical protein